jgi:hypothetical protein
MRRAPRAANTLAAHGARRMLFLSAVCWRAARRKCKIAIFFFSTSLHTQVSRHPKHI